MEIEPVTPREGRLTQELLNLHLHRIQARGWFGKESFIAIPSGFYQLGVMIFRKREDGDYNVQMLESRRPPEEILRALRRRTGYSLPLASHPYLPTRRKWNYLWQWLIPIREYRAWAQAQEAAVLPKEELRKQVGAVRPPTSTDLPNYKRLPFSEKGGKPQRFWGRTHGRI